MDVLLTVDTELSPARSIATAGELAANIRGSYYGAPTGDGGIPFQLAVLREHGLKGVFFVEALASVAIGDEPIRNIVQLIAADGHEVQLHTHVEWLRIAREKPLGNATWQYTRHYSEAEQIRIIALGKEILARCGAPNVNAFRAGGFAADNATLRALRANAIQFDSSYNYPYLGHECAIDVPGMLVDTAVVEGIVEVPVTCFMDRPGHFRHTQVCACSFSELSSMLTQAHAAGFATFVIVCHSFELITRDRTRTDPIAVARFRKLCRFLADHRDRFRTVGFDGVDPTARPPKRPLKSSIWRTGARYVAQAVDRFYQ